MPPTADHVRNFAVTSFFFVTAAVCTVNNEFFYMAGVNIFLFEN